MVDDKISPIERFNFAVNIVLNHEGGYVNNPYDIDGPTNFGITQSDLTSCCHQVDSLCDVKKLTKNDAIIFYKSEYWDKYHFEVINSLYLATKIFDMTVNMGPREAFSLVQRAINSCSDKVDVDGVLGGLTLGAINSISLRGQEEDLKLEIQEEQRSFYENLVSEKPHLNVFLAGWLARAAY